MEIPSARHGMVRGTPRTERSDRQRTSSPARHGRAWGRRERCLPVARERTGARRSGSSAAATALTVLQLVLTSAPAGATCERGLVLAGVTQSSRVGDLGFAAADRYELGDSLSDVYPYTEMGPTERLSAWCEFGFATEKLALTGGNGNGGEEPLRRCSTAVGFSLGTLGMRDVQWTSEEMDGYALSLESDALCMRVAPDAVSDPRAGTLATVEPDAVRALRDSRLFDIGPNRLHLPPPGAGTRRDGGVGTRVELRAALGLGTH